MVKFIRLDKAVAVAPQLAEADFAELAAQGFRSVVNNRPDGESPDQLTSAEAEAAARRAGLEYRYRPVTHAIVTSDDAVDDFGKMLAELPGPVLFYCRSGTRCATLWAQEAAGRLGVDGTLETARAAGYDMNALRGTLEARVDTRRK